MMVMVSLLHLAILFWICPLKHFPLTLLIEPFHTCFTDRHRQNQRRYKFYTHGTLYAVSNLFMLIVALFCMHKVMRT